MMKKETKLVNKVKRLLRKAGLPRWLHRYEPKKYEFWHHALALLIRAECRFSFRRVVKFLRNIGFICLSIYYKSKNNKSRNIY